MKTMLLEEKRLLFDDLCGRLRHGVKCSIYRVDDVCFGWRDAVFSGVVFLNDELTDFELYFDGAGLTTVHSMQNVRPYLRPIRSITEDEERELNGCLQEVHDFSFRNDELLEPIQMEEKLPSKMQDFSTPTTSTTVVSSGKVWQSKHPKECIKQKNRAI